LKINSFLWIPLYICSSHFKHPWFWQAGGGRRPPPPGGRRGGPGGSGPTMGPLDFCWILGFHKQIAIYFNQKQKKQCPGQLGCQKDNHGCQLGPEMFGAIIGPSDFCRPHVLHQGLAVYCNENNENHCPGDLWRTWGPTRGPTWQRDFRSQGRAKAGQP